MLSRKRASHCPHVPNKDLSFRVEKRKNAMVPNETTFREERADPSAPRRRRLPRRKWKGRMLSRKHASHCLHVPNKEPADLCFRVEERKNAMAPNETTSREERADPLGSSKKTSSKKREEVNGWGIHFVKTMGYKAVAV
ncbi:hypothetical protein CDAR_184221 [Caerostris darwini]|uniref:Uncharacterized protein n=1 Tax=Caerostris darwini TaxID=1538125 RepID=A0AAV4VZI6_9ARAC|nr:hypothetical protein CDAR_184221 [Caerostris darwini]